MDPKELTTEPSDVADTTGTKRGLASFMRGDHTYVYLGTSVLALIAVCLLQTPSTRMSFLTPGSALQLVVQTVLFAWLALSGLALVTKLVRWNSYSSTWAKKAPVVRVSRYLSYVVWLFVVLVVIDRAVLWFAVIWEDATSSTTNPHDFIGGAIYMVNTSKTMYIQGITTTLGLSVFGTAIAFFLALLLVFLRIQEPARSDNDFVKFLKIVGAGFAKVYSSVVRGTPMMVQGLIIYFAGFAIFRSTGMSVSQVTQVWTYFIAGLVIISLNSTAYIMESLRGGIEAVDPGQTEAARSLGLSQWQAMRKVVFPQGIRNAIPALSNEVVINIKDSSVLSVVGVFDLMLATTTVAGIYYRQMEVYVVAALIYLVMTYVATRLLTALAHKLDVQEPGVLPSSN